eukprot:8026285-Lingulodinium_polyedra.AAC.1
MCNAETSKPAFERAAAQLQIQIAQQRAHTRAATLHRCDFRPRTRARTPHAHHSCGARTAYSRA